MRPVYHLSMLRFLWDVMTVPGVSSRYRGSENFHLVYKTLSWFEFLKKNYRDGYKWVIKWGSNYFVPCYIGFYDDYGKFVEVIRVRADGGPNKWQDPWTLNAYSYFNDKIYRI